MTDTIKKFQQILKTRHLTYKKGGSYMLLGRPNKQGKYIHHNTWWNRIRNLQFIEEEI